MKNLCLTFISALLIFTSCEKEKKPADNPIDNPGNSELLDKNWKPILVQVDGVDNSSDIISSSYLRLELGSQALIDEAADDGYIPIKFTAYTTSQMTYSDILEYYESDSILSLVGIETWDFPFTLNLGQTREWKITKVTANDLQLASMDGIQEIKFHLKK